MYLKLTALPTPWLWFFGSSFLGFLEVIKS